jgi:hypothetical protein
MYIPTVVTEIAEEPPSLGTRPNADNQAAAQYRDRSARESQIGLRVCRTVCRTYIYRPGTLHCASLLHFSGSVVSYGKLGALRILLILSSQLKGYA